MQVSSESTGPLERQLKVQIPEERIAVQVKQRLDNLSRTTKVDGFRPGKVPLKLLEKRFGARVRQEVVGEIVRSSLAEAIDSEHLKIAGAPTIEPVKDQPGEGLEYTATFEILPEVSLLPVEDLKVARPSCQVTEQELDKMVETLRSQHKTWEPAGRAAEAGDRLAIDFVGTIDGEAFEGGSAQGFRLELGSHSLIEGFEDGLLGVTPDEQRQLDLQFPDDYGKPELAGKPVQFAVTVKEVEQSRLPELNEELFASFGVKEGGLEAFRAEVRKNMEREVGQAVQQRSKQAVFDALYKANPIALPQTLVAQEANRLLQETRQRLTMQGADPEQLKEMQSETFNASAAKRVALGLLMAEIIKKASLKAEPAKVREFVETIASSYEQPSTVIKWYYEEPGRLANIESSVLEQNVVEWILERCQVTDLPTTFDALMNPRQTESQV
jgi:trigger factor